MYKLVSIITRFYVYSINYVIFSYMKIKMSNKRYVITRKQSIPTATTPATTPTQTQLAEQHLLVNNILNNIIETLIDKKILCILNKIHNVYPTKFTKENIQNEFNIIKKKIHIINKTDANTNANRNANTDANTDANTNANTNANTDANTNANTDANTNINELSLLSEHILQPTLQEQTQQTQQYPAPLVYKSHCNARIWGFIYDKTTLKQIISLDKIYKVKYTTKFKLNDFNNKYILGSRCMRNLDMPDNIYCHQHIQHLTHGNYNDVPDAEMCIHFIKDGKYLLNRI